MSLSDEQQRHPYRFAFDVGLKGTLVLLGGLLFAWEHHMVILSAMFAWMLVTIFALPWLYLLYYGDDITIPSWLYRGPHQ